MSLQDRDEIIIQLRAEIERLREEIRFLARDRIVKDETGELRAEIERLKAESAGRLKVLKEKAAEAKVEWLRAERAEAKLERVLEAATTLQTKIDRLESTPEYKAVWTLAAIHGQPYRGENWKIERDALRAALAAAKGEK